MQECSRVIIAVIAASCMLSCGTGRKSAAPAPESEQVIGEKLKELYMAASTAPRQSTQQQKLILQMAEKASCGKELLLVMRAAMGVFPSGAAMENQVRSTVTAKMIEVATLDQMIDFATQYAVDEAHTRTFVERMFQLGDGNNNPRVWYRIRAAAMRLKVGDLGQQAQAKGDDLSRAQ